MQNNIIDFETFKKKAILSLSNTAEELTEKQFNLKKQIFTDQMDELSKLQPQHWLLMGSITNIDSAIHHLGKFNDYLIDSIDELIGEIEGGLDDAS